MPASSKITDCLLKTKLWNLFLRLLTIESGVSLFFLMMIPGENNSYSMRRLLLLFTLLALFFLHLVVLFYKPFKSTVMIALEETSLRMHERMSWTLFPIAVLGFSSMFLFQVIVPLENNYLYGIFLRLAPFVLWLFAFATQFLIIVVADFHDLMRWAWLIPLQVYVFAMLNAYLTSEQHDYLPMLALIIVPAITVLYRSLMASFIINKKHILPIFLFVFMAIALLRLMSHLQQITMIPHQNLTWLNIGVGTIIIYLLLQRQDKIPVKARVIAMLVTAGLLYFAVNAYIPAAIHHAETINTDYTKSDQDAYIQFAQEVKTSGFTYTGTRNRMPLYVSIQALFVQDGQDALGVFEQGKIINIYLCLILLAGFWIVFSLFFSKYQSLLVTAMSGAGLYLYKAPYFQSEPLFYFFNSLAFVLMCVLFKRRSNMLALLTGILVGLAYLTKASVLPGLAIFFAIYGFQQTAVLVKSHRFDLKAYSNLAWVFVGFLGLLTPYGLESQRDYGNFFYNVNTSHYMWADTFPEGVEIVEQLGPREAPGMAEYFQTHTLSQIVDRVQFGIWQQWLNIRYQPGLVNYTLSFFLLFVALLFTSRNVAKMFVLDNLYLVIFVGMFMAVHVSAYIWYSVIAEGPRFIAALYIPLIFSVFWLGKYISRISLVEKHRIAGKDIFLVYQILMTGLVIWDIIFTINTGLFRDLFSK